MASKTSKKGCLEYWQADDGYWYFQLRKGKKVTPCSFSIGYTTSSNCRRGARREHTDPTLPLVRITQP